MYTEKEKNRKREYYFKNRDKILKNRKIHFLKNKEIIYKYRKINKDKNINIRLSQNLRTRLWCALKREYKKGSAVRDLGCSIPELKIYLEQRFTEGMDWSNYGNVSSSWSIDHIKPLSNFDLTNKEELLRAVHYTNLQPMWLIDNIKKSNKYENEYKFQKLSENI
jgi:hypothetical protein